MHAANSTVNSASGSMHNGVKIKQKIHQGKNQEKEIQQSVTITVWTGKTKLIYEVCNNKNIKYRHCKVPVMYDNQKQISTCHATTCIIMYWTKVTQARRLSEPMTDFNLNTSTVTVNVLLTKDFVIFIMITMLYSTLLNPFTASGGRSFVKSISSKC